MSPLCSCRSCSCSRHFSYICHLFLSSSERTPLRACAARWRRDHSAACVRRRQAAARSRRADAGHGRRTCGGSPWLSSISLMSLSSSGCWGLSVSGTDARTTDFSLSGPASLSFFLPNPPKRGILPRRRRHAASGQSACQAKPNFCSASHTITARNRFSVINWHLEFNYPVQTLRCRWDVREPAAGFLCVRIGGGTQR